MAHIESCKKCKEAFLSALKNKYKNVIEQWKPKWPCKIDDILALRELDKRIATQLRRTYKSLEDYRGYKNFIRSTTIPACDYYIPVLNCIIEFDESQHFTAPRALTLLNYRNHLELGFDKKEWLSRCNELDRHDNDKRQPHRDETRAWYDTLRDILPLHYNLKPTVRVYAKSAIWCRDTSKITKLLEGIS